MEKIKQWATGFNELNPDHYYRLQQDYEQACRTDYLGYCSADHQR